MSDQQNRFMKLLGILPIFRRLHEVPKEALVEARTEIVYATFFSTMPFWFLPIIGGIIFLERPSFWAGIVGGELFIYAATLAGPLFYIITKRHGRFKVPSGDDDTEDTPLTYAFPEGMLLTVATVIICILSGVIFTLQKLKDIKALENIEIINESGLVYLSIFVFLFSTAILFCVLAYRNMLEALSEEHTEKINQSLSDAEDRTMADWIERKGK